MNDTYFSPDPLAATVDDVTIPVEMRRLCPSVVGSGRVLVPDVDVDACGEGKGGGYLDPPNTSPYRSTRYPSIPIARLGGTTGCCCSTVTRLGRAIPSLGPVPILARLPKRVNESATSGLLAGEAACEIHVLPRRLLIASSSSPASSPFLPGDSSVSAMRSPGDLNGVLP